MATTNDFVKIADWYDTLWRSDKTRDYTFLIREKLSLEVDDTTRKSLQHMLIWELVRLGRFDEEIDHLNQLVASDPDDVALRIRVAESYLYHKQDAVSAMKASEVAYQLSKRLSFLLRHALNVRARCARALERYSLLEMCLKEIMATVPDYPFDLDVETDFIDDVPIGALPPDLVSQFRKFAEKRK